MSAVSPVAVVERARRRIVRMIRVRRRRVVVVRYRVSWSIVAALRWKVACQGVMGE